MAVQTIAWSLAGAAAGSIIGKIGNLDIFLLYLLVVGLMVAGAIRGYSGKDIVSNIADMNIE